MLRLISLCLFAFSSYLFFQCGSNRGIDKKPVNANATNTLRLALPEPVLSLFPLFNTDVQSHRVLGNIFEPLFDVTEKNVLISRLVDSYSWNKEGDRVKLHLKKKVFFHHDACFGGDNEELTSEDVAFTLNLACSQNKLNQSSDAILGKIVGAVPYYNQVDRKNGVEGIKILDRYTIELHLTGSYPNFLYVLSSSKYGIVSKKAYAYYQDNIVKHPIGTGPFQLYLWSATKIILSANPQYWKKDAQGNPLPYLKAIEFSIFRNKKEELSAFRNQQLDFVFDVPSQHVDDLLGDFNLKENPKTFPHKVLVIPGAKTSLLCMNPSFKPFKDPLVRKAIDLLIDRNYIAEELIAGDGIPALKGFAPNSPYYNNQSMADKTFSETQALSLLKEAGYSNANPFPKIELFVPNTDPTSISYGKHIVERINTVLKIPCVLHVVSPEERIQAIRQNKAQIWKIGWSPDYPDAEAYFSLFYSKNPNTADQNPLFPKFHSESYDLNYQMATKEKESVTRNNFFTNCDGILQAENWILPIMYEDFVYIFHVKCRGISVSSVGVFDFTNTFIKPL